MISAPMTGARIGAMTDMLCTTARAVALVDPSKQSLIMAMDRDTIPPAPIPCTMRIRIRK